jgi:hypothetical protein
MSKCNGWTGSNFRYKCITLQMDDTENLTLRKTYARIDYSQYTIKAGSFNRMKQETNNYF